MTFEDWMRLRGLSESSVNKYYNHKNDWQKKYNSKILTKIENRKKVKKIENKLKMSKV